MLTDPNNDTRTWFYAHFYADGGAVVTASSTPDATRTLLASNRICAIGQYNGLGFTPWNASGPTHRQNLTSVEFASDMAGLACLKLRYIFYSCNRLSSVTGLGNLANVQSMYFMFASCSALTILDFRGFDPSDLAELDYAISSCSSLTTIYADSTWALLASGVSGSQCVYSSSSLVGGTAPHTRATRRRTRTSGSTRHPRPVTSRRPSRRPRGSRHTAACPSMLDRSLAGRSLAPARSRFPASA